MQQTSTAQALPADALPDPVTDPAPDPAFIPPTRAAWLAVLSVGIGSFALVTTEFLPVGLLPSIAAELRISEGTAGMMVTLPGIIAAFAAILVTIGIGKTDRRYVIAGLTTTLIVSNLIVAFSDSFTLILLARALLGVGVGGFWAIGGAIGTRLVSAPYAARATSIIFAGVSVGTVAGVPAGALLGEIAGWRAAFLATGAVGTVVLVLQLALMPSLPAAGSLTFRQVPELLRIKKARLGMAVTLLVFIGQFSAYTYVTPFLVQVAQLGAGVISALFLAYGVAGFIGNLVGGWLVARSVRRSLMTVGLVIGLSTLALPLVGTSLAGVVLLIVTWGLGFGMMPISVQSWMFKAAPHAMESGGAVFVSTAQVALAGGALVGGIVADHLGVSGVMIAGGAFALAMALVIWRFGDEDGGPSVKLTAVH
ncbi:MFS transporter [Duganella sp. FT27W]|uniref:MFS transporter n=1 Tax=Duganella sp. FT27W TaxID=2654636 RepID=UPI00186B8F3C|nr:MFS transporter [Duganella sp. FT27W]